MGTMKSAMLWGIGLVVGFILIIALLRLLGVDLPNFLE